MDCLIFAAMLQIGQYQSLEILRHVSPGLFLGDDEGNEVLLPNKYIPEGFTIGDKIEVFIYLDFDERLVATTLKPYITLHEFALLEVKDVSTLGAFMDWGLEKDLFVPFREQLSKMRKGGTYLVFMYEDLSTGRLVASQKVKKFLDNEVLTVTEGEEVDLIAANTTDLGVNVIVNGKHLGLVYHDEIYTELLQGKRLKGYVKTIREDHKLDISLQKAGYASVEPNAQKILDMLQVNKGFISLNDDSDPERIKGMLGMSKKTFKKAVGLLYKQKRIVLENDGIRLLV
jgi:predicted RNA-binding protein (virulence factor B family)